MKVDYAGARALKLLCPSIRADKNDSISLDRDRFCVCLPFVSGVNVAVDQDEVSRRRSRSRRRQPEYDQKTY